MKKSILSFFLVLIMAIGVIGNQETEVAAKAKYITNQNFRGTFTIGGEKCTYESGGYELVIGKISSDGTVKLQLHRWSCNAGKIADTDIIKTKIKKKKAVFTFTDSYDGSLEKGILTFRKDKTVDLEVKVLKEAEFYGYSLAIGENNFQRVSKKHKLWKPEY